MIQVLLIHPSAAVRRIVKESFAVEFGTMDVSCVTPVEAMAALNMRRFDMILSGIEMEPVDGIEIHQAMVGSPNQDRPFIALTSSHAPAQATRLAAHGIREVLLTPFSSDELRQVISRVYIPQAQRRASRHVIPDARVLLHVDGAELLGDLINISDSGLLCDQRLQRNIPDVYRPLMLSLLFPAEKPAVRLDSIWAKVVRTQVSEWTPDHQAVRLQLAWSFLKVPEEVRQALARRMGVVPPAKEW